MGTTDRMRLVVVEDNVDSADTLVMLLELWGYRARVAYHGRTGLEAVRQEVPDCVISDIGLPGLDGYELARAVRADPKLAGVHLVSLSAYAEPERAAAAGYEYSLRKPADMAELERVLKQVASGPRD